jgi:hypothetical protein
MPRQWALIARRLSRAPSSSPSQCQGPHTTEEEDAMFWATAPPSYRECWNGTRAIDHHAGEGYVD